jgi:HK97 family phage major capsid protein
MNKLKELIEKRARLVEQMKALVARADTENRSMTTEESAQWDQINNDVDATTKDIERREKIEAQERHLAGTDRPVITRNIKGAEETTITERNDETTEQRKLKLEGAFNHWVRFGFEGMNAEQRSIMNHRRSYLSHEDFPEELRAQSTTTTAGGYLIPEGFSNELERKLKAYGGVRSVARVLTTPSGNDVPWPTVDDTSNVGELLTENSAVAAQDVAFGQVILKAYKYSSKVVLVSMELLQDSAFDINSLLSDLLSERLGRITNTHFTTGDNSSKPQGVVSASGVGVTGVSGQTTSVTGDDLIDLEHSINSAYRAGGRFMMADSTLKAVKKIKDTQGRYMWLPGLVAGEPNTILGYGYTINDDMATMAANAKSIVFANFSKFIVRDVMQVTLLRLVERYAEYGQVGFIAFSRHDSRAINADAIKHYANSAV